MKRILITGGTGFFGKSILDYFSRRGGDFEFTILSRRGMDPGWLRGSLPFGQILGDIRTFESGGAHFDWVIHAATPARVDVPDDEMRSIILDGTDNALRQAKKCGAEKFMMVSSGGVYGKGLVAPVSEDDAPHPVTAYGIAKLEAERMAADSGLHALLPRCFAFVGPYLDRQAHFAIGNFMRDALAGTDIVINGDGTPMRSYLYADDLVEWLFAILAHGISGRPYNVGSPEAISIRDLAQTVLDSVNEPHAQSKNRRIEESENSPIAGRSADRRIEKSPNHRAIDESKNRKIDESTNRRIEESKNRRIDESKNRRIEKSENSPTIRVLGAAVPGAANYYVPDVGRIVKELGVRVKVGLREAIRRSCEGERPL